MLLHTTQEAMPAFVSMVAMPYTFSIGYGIIGGLLLWTLGMISLCHVDVHYKTIH